MQLELNKLRRMVYPNQADQNEKPNSTAYVY